MSLHLSIEDVLTATEAALGSPARVRDYGLLASAVARPQTSVMGEDAYPSVAMKAAALLQSLARNHALVDGNKRTALLAALGTLRLNGHVIRIRDQQALADLVSDVATGDLVDLAVIAEQLVDAATSQRPTRVGQRRRPPRAGNNP